MKQFICIKKNKSNCKYMTLYQQEKDLLKQSTYQGYIQKNKSLIIYSYSYAFARRTYRRILASSADLFPMATKGGFVAYDDIQRIEGGGINKFIQQAKTGCVLGYATFPFTVAPKILNNISNVRWVMVGDCEYANWDIRNETMPTIADFI